MTANRERPHLLVLPEDDANRQIVTGFCSRFETKQIQILNEARGWPGVCRKFENDYIKYMRNYEKAFIALIVDFDEQIDRSEEVRNYVPSDLADRVFVLGAWKDPEELKRAQLGHFELIGEKLARDCPSAAAGIWSHAMLAHNLDEITRFRSSACSTVLLA